MFQVDFDAGASAARDQQPLGTASHQVELLSLIKREVLDHFETFPEDYQSSDLRLGIRDVTIGAKVVSASLTIAGTVNGLPCDSRCSRHVDIGVARKKQAMRALGQRRNTFASDAMARAALGPAGVALMDAYRVARHRREQDKRFDQGRATTDEMELGMEAAARELFAGLCDAALSHLDQTVGRRRGTSVGAWRAISISRWLFAVANFIAMAIAEYSSPKGGSLMGACVVAAIFLPLAFFGVHFAGLAFMPRVFFTREAAGRAAMKSSGLKTVAGVRIMAAIGATLFLGIIAGVWWIAATFE